MQDKDILENVTATVSTSTGDVVGLRVASGAVFRGVPYAASPIGDLRFRPPQPHPTWDTPRLATAFGPSAPQSLPAPPFGLLFQPAYPSESGCLTLNVWSPDIGEVGLPVMVWIHGGGLADGCGADPAYDGINFSRDGVVFVSINYRLGILGFLHTGAISDFDSGTGCFGLLDQVAALEWIQLNIARFGGDPSNVTIFGESAGGWSVASLLVAPAARGLFARAICQSGAGSHALSPQTAERVAQRFLELVHVRSGDSDSLAGLSVDEILVAQEILYGEGMATDQDASHLLGDSAGLLLCLLPVIGVDLPGRPEDLVAEGKGADVDLLVGSNREEYGLYHLVKGGIFSEETMRSTAELGLQQLGRSLNEVLLKYAFNRRIAFLGAYEQLETDRFFRAPTLRLARNHARSGGKTYLYSLNWSGTALGSCHVSDVPFVFDQLNGTMGRILVGENAPQSLANDIHHSWVEFAKSGQPHLDDGTPWHQYDTDKRMTMNLDIPCKESSDPDRFIREIWVD